MPKFDSDGKFSCLFCYALMDEPRDYNRTYECPDCGALYIVELADGGEDAAVIAAADHFKVPEEDIEVRSEDFDSLSQPQPPLAAQNESKDEDDAIPVCIYFARVRPPAQTTG